MHDRVDAGVRSENAFVVAAVVGVLFATELQDVRSNLVLLLR